MIWDDSGWFGMICGESRLGVAIRIRPGVAKDRSGSDLGWPWTDPDPDLDRIGPDWIGLDRVRIDLDWIWTGSWSDLGPSWMQTEHVESDKSLFSNGICMFYVCLGNVGLYAILGPT